MTGIGKHLFLLIGTITAIVLVTSQSIHAIPFISELLDGTWFSWTSLNGGLDPSSTVLAGQTPSAQNGKPATLLGKITIAVIAVFVGLAAIARILISRALKTLMDG